MTLPTAIPIKMYRKIQTGANIQLGGVKKGFSNVWYQVLTDVWVAKLAIKPTPKQSSDSKSNMYPQLKLHFQI